MVELKFRRVNPLARLPERQSDGAGGYDVYAADCKFDRREGCVVVSLGFALEIPKGYKVTIVPRSSITRTTWLIQNSPCLVDSDYRGEIVLKFRCMDKVSDFPYAVGDRVAQLYVEEVIPITFIETDELTETERGSGGFGSTGR